MRYSFHRDKILEILKERTDKHYSAEEIYQELKKAIPKVSLMTVYRNLDRLKKEGTVIPIGVHKVQHYCLVSNELHFHLTIIGSGPDEIMLKNLAKELQITHQVTFLGFKNNPYKYMAHADVFAFTSRYEGFPNVLLESCACGLPIVAFNCVGGINKIIEDGINGFKVNVGDINSFAKYLVKASKTQFNPKQIISTVKYKYDVVKIIDQYESIIDSL